MRKILVCQHVGYEVLGTLDSLLRQSGFRIRYANFDRHPDARPALKDDAGLILLGGPMNCDEVARHPHLLHERRLIEEAIAKEIPVLGICLGAQLIARALGAPVHANGGKEIGWFEISVTDAGKKDPLIRHLGERATLFQWHCDTFDLPKGAVNLADSETCRYQAFRYGDKVYAFQFHLEVDEAMIHRWLQIPELSTSSADPKAIAAETAREIGNLKNLSDLVFGEFIKLFGVEKKFKHLPSR